jgi:CRISPR/Cas system-associated exonuclease Cas4 (RecB family)
MTITIRKSPEFTDLLQKNLNKRYEERRRLGDSSIHVSDILPTNCIRKQYYSRKFPEIDPISNESVHHFVRGEASEFVITNLANMGVAQAELEMDGLIAHPDIMNEEKGERGGEATEVKAKGQSVIVELKDTVNGKRLDITDQKFTSYLRQLLYYLVMTGIEKGIISIRYNSREVRWTKSDSEGDYFFRPYNGSDVGIESWQVFLPKEDIAREILKNEMIRRKSLFLKALQENNVSTLPRLAEAIRNTKCPYCKFYQKCMNEDSETEDAREMEKEIDLLDISGVVDFKPFSPHDEFTEDKI